MNRRPLSQSLSFEARVGILLALTGLALAGLLSLEPIAQDPAYHLLADHRTRFGIPHFFDVASNAGFALIGALGVLALTGRRGDSVFFQPADARPYLVFFIGIACVSLGSAYYHWDPTNERLVWDRLPMSVAFMGFAAAVVADRIHARAGNGWLLAILVLLGLASVLYWHLTEEAGQGDLRPYAFVQFFPLVVLPFVVRFFPDHRYLPGRGLAWIIFWYGLSKLLELYDREVFGLLGSTVSGHTLKHLTAAVGALVLLRIVVSRRDANGRRDMRGERGTE